MSLNDTCFVLLQPAQLMPGERLRVAYVSSDFGNHPLSHLMGSVFGLHDRSRVSTRSIHGLGACTYQQCQSHSNHCCCHMPIVCQTMGFSWFTHILCCG